MKPAKEGAATNLNLVTASGEVSPFLLTEKNGASMPDLKVYVNADPNAPKGKPKFYSAAQVESLQAELRRHELGWKPRTDARLNRSRASAGAGEAAVLIRLSQVEALPGPIDLARRAVHLHQRTQQNCLRSTK